MPLLLSALLYLTGGALGVAFANVDTPAANPARRSIETLKGIETLKVELETRLSGAEAAGYPCFPDLVMLADVEVHLVTSYGDSRFENPDFPGHDIKRVYVEESRAPTGLILVSSATPTIWQFTVEPEADLDFVILVGEQPALVAGLPIDTMLFSLSHAPSGERRPFSRCWAEEEVANSIMHEVSFYTGPIRVFEEGPILARVNSSLEELGSGGLASVSRLMRGEDRVGIGRESVRISEGWRWLGETVQRFAEFPDLGYPPNAHEAAKLSKTDDLDEFLEQLYFDGALVDAPLDVADFLCAQEFIGVMRQGAQPMVHPDFCNARSQWYDYYREPKYVLLRDVEIEGGLYTCRSDERSVEIIYVPPDISVSGELIDCGLNIGLWNRRYSQ
ncbi:hypothetical protein ACW9UR_23820 [Halovulum sp. GXIMD14794]